MNNNTNKDIKNLLLNPLTITLTFNGFDLLEKDYKNFGIKL